MVRTILIALIRFYRFAFSALFGHVCRFHPTCSAYAMEAINVHGCGKGCYYALRRVLRCHPWHAGGIDPIP
jgi:putative membrane protein insertion efficiency factor